MERRSPLHLEKIRQSFTRFCEDRPEEQTIYFKDIVSGEHMEHGRVPVCIREQDPMCAQGLATLKRLGAKNFNLAFMFGCHDKPKDFFDLLDDPAMYELLQNSPYVAIEANASTDSQGILVKPRDTGRGSFQQTQLQWLQARDKLVLPCDIDTPEDPTIAGGTLRQTMRELFALQTSIENTPMPNDTKNQLLSLGIIYYHLLREDMMLGQLGYWLQQIEARGALPDSPISIPFMLGDFHRAIAEKASAYMGVSPQVHSISSPLESALLFVQIARQGRVTYDQLDAFTLD